MADHNDLGIKGEVIALDFLKHKGYEILAQNYRYKHAEIDIIAKFQDILIFVEVKTRSTDKFGFPEEAVTEKKQEKLMEGALHYLEENDIHTSYRFDVISIVLYQKMPKIYHIEDAF